MSLCRDCGRELKSDEIAVTRKLINRAAEEFYCVDCLAKRFNVSAEEIHRLIANFKAAGCSLF